MATHTTYRDEVAVEIAKTHPSLRDELRAYLDAFVAAWGDYPVSTWEISAAIGGYMDGLAVEDVVATASLSHQCRRADRAL